jgi:hypothetical protein
MSLRELCVMLLCSTVDDECLEDTVCLHHLSERFIIQAYSLDFVTAHLTVSMHMLEIVWCHRRSERHCRGDGSLRTGDLTSIRNHSLEGKVETESTASLYNIETQGVGLRSARLLGLRVRIPPWAWMSVVCCQVEVFATGRSLFQSSPTECGLCHWVWLGATITLYTYSE